MGFTIDRNTIFGLAALFLWSATVALARSISEQIGPLAGGAFVYLTAGILLTCHFLLRERSIRKLGNFPPKYVFGCGALFLIYTAALFLALGLAANRDQTIEVGLLNYLWPALTILFSLFILGKKARVALVPGTLLALVGIFLVLTQRTSITWNSFLTNLSSNPNAYGLGIAAAISWALYSNLTRLWGESSADGAVPLFILITGLVLFLFSLLHPEQGAWSVGVVAEIVFLAVATALAYVFWDIAMRKGDVALVVSCSYLTPFLSTVVSCIYLGVLPGISLWVGCTLIISGSYVSWRSIVPEE
ncbi:MAG: aromatic amino acid DMT transporter YddG [bacterium]